MPIGDIIYLISAFLFAYMTFIIIRGNFKRKFDEHGERLDLKDKRKREERELK